MSSNNNTINEEGSDDINTPLNSSSSGSSQDVLSIGNIDRFLNHDLNLSGIVLKEDSTIKILNDKLFSMNQNFIALKNEVLELKKEIWDTWDSIYYVEKDMANFQQYSRRENIEICGIPEGYDDTNLEFTVINILKRIGLPNLSSYDIVACTCKCHCTIC